MQTTQEVFENYFTRNIHRAVKKSISESTLDEAKSFALLVIAEKMKEQVHKIDGTQHHKRFTTGISGELAVQALFGKQFVDMTVGSSSAYNHGDLTPIGFNVGVKTVERGKFPLVEKNSMRPEIIVVKDNNDYYIMGLALPAALRRYQDERLVLTNNENLKKRKGGFFGFDRLQPFHSFEEFICIMEDHPAFILS